MAFLELVRKISPKLKGIAYRLNNRHTFFNNDDLYQEALIHLWGDFRKGRLAEKTESYILQGCYFYLKNYIRKNSKRKVFLSLEPRDRDCDNPGSIAPEIADSFDKSAYLAYLNDKCLAEVIMNNGLTSKEKEILSFYADGLTTREIGGRLGVSHVQVIKLTRRIRQKCLRYLDYGQK